jgi:hypothetical protein
MMVEVQVQVPETHVAEFYAMYGLWLQRVQRGDADGGLDTRQRWTPEDGELAAQVWPELPPNCAKMLEFVIERGITDAKPLVEALDYKEPTQLVGVNGWIGRICARFDRRSPIKASATPNGTVWSIDTEIGEMFKQAKTA